MDQEIKKLAESFFEWPTENKSFVTLTSAILFAEKIAELRQAEIKQLKEELNCVLAEWNALIVAVESPTNGGAVGHARALNEELDRYREVLEKIARVNACDYEYQRWAREVLSV